jgi:hypothetical protein
MIPSTYGGRQKLILGSALLAIALSVSPTIAGAADATGAELLKKGERLYRQGISVDGSRVQARSQSDVPISGADAACATCHRFSGFGSSEGGYYVPPITGPILYAERKLDRARLFPEMFRQVQPPAFYGRLYQPHLRPSYDAESLKHALLQGIDPAGNSLASIMPRYRLTDADVHALASYLKQLSSQKDPGVDAKEIHFATIFADNVPATSRHAVLRTMQAYIDWHNQHMRNDSQRSNFSPYNRSDFVPFDKQWTLSVWSLHGQEGTWTQQIEDLYREHPVFAIIGGVVPGSLAVLARYCEREHIPYLFPDTDLPVADGAEGGYTIYFSAGLIQEARVIARRLAAGGAPINRVVQLAASDPLGQMPARALQEALAAGAGDVRQQLLDLPSADRIGPALDAARLDARTALVVWPGRESKDCIAALFQARTGAAQIFLPSRFIGDASHAPSGVLERLRFAQPREINVAAHPKSFQVRGWMHARGIEIEDVPLQFETYYMLNLMEAALSDIRDDFYRDYLMERIERESEKDLNPGIYPRLALGPGQRYASKGAYIVRLDPANPGTVLPDGDWIVPQSGQ